MIKQHFVRAFERGARRNHIPNIELQRYICEVFHVMEDSTLVCSKSRDNRVGGAPVNPYRLVDADGRSLDSVVFLCLQR